MTLPARGGMTSPFELQFQLTIRTAHDSADKHALGVRAITDAWDTVRTKLAQYFHYSIDAHVEQSETDTLCSLRLQVPSMEYKQHAIEAYNHLLNDLLPHEPVLMQCKSNMCRSSLPDTTTDDFPSRAKLFLDENNRRLKELQDKAQDDTEISKFCTAITESLSAIHQAIISFGPDALGFSYNGGKDCTVLLHLLLWCFASWFESEGRWEDFVNTFRLQTVYILPKKPFEQVEVFADRTAAFWNMELVRIPMEMKVGLQEFIRLHPQINAIFVGTRATDPYCKHLKEFSPTDPGWPKFVRVNPLLQWGYSDIWKYIHYFDIPYCILYDRGYTSLGCTDNTLPNPFLKDPRQPFGYKPAHMLQDHDGQEERAGRQ